MAQYARAGQALSAREVEVVELMAQGLSNKLIADRLDVTPHTVKYHVVNVCRKLGATTRTLAVVNWLVGKRCPNCRYEGFPAPVLVGRG